MKKNLVSMILGGIVVVEFMFLLQYKARADQNEELELIRQTEAEMQIEIAVAEHERANSLQQQLDKCK